VLFLRGELLGNYLSICTCRPVYTQTEACVHAHIYVGLRIKYNTHMKYTVYNKEESEEVGVVNLCLECARIDYLAGYQLFFCRFP
jgi:hypothetical protein